MKNPPIHGIEVFLAIVQEGSLRAAARYLGVGAPAVSHQLKALEEKMGVDLLIRTTRSIELTEAGRVILTTAAPAYRDIINAIQKTQEISQSASGTLRLTLPRSAYQVVIAPILKDFQTRYPDICLDISLHEGLVDIVKEGFHAGIRLADRLTPEMVAVRLSDNLMPAFSASPDYLNQHGRPQHPRDLLNHQCIRYRFISANQIADWKVVEDGQTKLINPPTRLVFDRMEAVVLAACDGYGIGWSLRSTIANYLEFGLLETVLDNYVKEVPPFYLYYPEQNRRLECLRLLINCLVEKRDSIKH